MKTEIFAISPVFARHKNIPQLFAGIVLRETARAVYVYGHGTMETRKTGRCCQCGRSLTHPVSIELGIGPVCGSHYWDWNLVGGFSMENIERLKREMITLMENMKVDTWMPKSVIRERTPSDEHIILPPDHPMLKSKENTVKQRRMVELIERGSYMDMKIIFPYNPEDVFNVKTLEGRRFQSNDKEKFWTAPLTTDNAQKLISWDFEMDERIHAYLNKSKVDIDTLDESAVKINGIGMELFPYQKKGVAFVEAKDGRALIADEMGLGKTAQALAWLQMRKDALPALVVVPASLKLNWKREVGIWMDETISTKILQGTTPHKRTDADVTIINYDVLATWLPALKDAGFKTIVADEIHYVKNNGAKRTKALKQLVKNVPHFVGLSGTPITNRPIEFYNAIKIVDPMLFPNFMDYARKYCGAKHNGYGWDFTGATNTQELHNKLTTSIMIRRKKADVLTELPDKIHSFTPMELGNRNDYRRAELDFISYLKDTKGDTAAIKASQAEVLTTIEGLKQLAVHGKLDEAIQWIHDFLENDQKLVVFATHRNVINHVMEAFKDTAVKVDGSVTGEERQRAVDRFQNDDRIRLFVGNIKAAGVGLTLTAASNVAFLELPWTPGDLTQAEDRCHRIGQKDAVNVHYLLAQGTIEEQIASLLDKKRKVLDSVLDGQETQEESLITELINSYTDENN